MTVTHETDPREQTLDERIVEVMAKGYSRGAWPLAEIDRRMAVRIIAELRDAGLAVVPVEPKLWLWRNHSEARGDHYLAFASEYPTAADGGDPAVLGEPSATAVFLPTARK